MELRLSTKVTRHESQLSLTHMSGCHPIFFRTPPTNSHGPTVPENGMTEASQHLFKQKGITEE